MSDPSPATPAPVEVSTRYATTCPELTDAFAFVMTHLDSVGPDPEVHIRPIWRCDHAASDAHGSVRVFDVAVSGTIDQPAQVDAEHKADH